MFRTVAICGMSYCHLYKVHKMSRQSYRVKRFLHWKDSTLTYLLIRVRTLGLAVLVWCCTWIDGHQWNYLCDTGWCHTAVFNRQHICLRSRYRHRQQRRPWHWVGNRPVHFFCDNRATLDNSALDNLFETELTCYTLYMVVFNIWILIRTLESISTYIYKRLKTIPPRTVVTCVTSSWIILGSDVMNCQASYQAKPHDKWKSG